MNKNLRKWIYGILILVLAIGVFYIVLEKEKPMAPDTSKEEDQNQEKPEVNPNLPEEQQADTDFPIIEIGKKLPDFTLKDLDGKDISLRELEGKIVLINFWATWCPWCDKEMADLNKLDRENDDLIVLGVNVDEPKAQVEKYVKEGGYDFKVVLDEEGLVAVDYLVTGLPASYFVNKEGIYVGRIPSYMTVEQMNEALEITRDY